MNPFQILTSCPHALNEANFISYFKKSLGFRSLHLLQVSFLIFWMLGRLMRTKSLLCPLITKYSSDLIPFENHDSQQCVTCLPLSS